MYMFCLLSFSTVNTLMGHTAQTTLGIPVTIKDKLAIFTVKFPLHIFCIVYRVIGVLEIVNKIDGTFDQKGFIIYLLYIER